MAPPDDNVLAFIWYRPDDYDTLLDATDDTEELADTYESWLDGAQQAFADYQDQGFEPHRVYIDVDAYLSWCQSRDRPVAKSSREIYKEVARQRFYRSQNQ